MRLALPDTTARHRFSKPSEVKAPPVRDVVSRPSRAEVRHARATVLWTFLPSVIVLALAVWALWQAMHSVK